MRRRSGGGFSSGGFAGTGGGGYGETGIEVEITPEGLQEVIVRGGGDTELAASLLALPVNATSQGDTPPPCEEGPSSASGGVGLAIYGGPGGEGAAGLHDGRVFATGRVGWGIGGGLTYNPAGGLPVTPSANAPGGHQLNVTGKAGVSGGIPFTDFGFSWQFELGVAYDSNDGFIVIKDFKAPKIGFPAEKGIRAAANIGGQVSLYSSRTTVYTNSGTCRAHY